MFSLRFSESKFLINSLRQFRVRKIFRTQILRGLQYFHLVFKITVSIVHDLLSRLTYYLNQQYGSETISQKSLCHAYFLMS